MATWIFEPGHTAAEFCVRHMMVTWVRGHFKDIHGSLEFDPDNPATLSMEVQIAAQKLWTGEPHSGGNLRKALSRRQKEELIRLAGWGSVQRKG